MRFLKWIYQLPQNVIGFLLSLGSIKKTYPLEDEEVTVYYNNRVFGCGVSLGDYIILDKKYLDLVSKPERVVTVMHEHGHQLQSRRLGWLYLIVIGIPSAFGNMIDRLFHKNWCYSDRVKWYYSQSWEAWADRLGKVNR